MGDENIVKTYSYKKTIIKGVKYFIIFLLSFLAERAFVLYPQFGGLTMGQLLDKILLMVSPDIGALTVGGFVVLFLNYLKYKWSLTPTLKLVRKI